ncbi:MAG: 2Fe-2S iron-sulfur cluster binding domain-containing protein, partial [Nitriliruptorales bacterium]|nr:2Fe-2S iron-sulfur cluster binding domain-containing protein [Nitriliruptorales bacterium]
MSAESHSADDTLVAVDLHVNGTVETVRVHLEETLLEALRERFDLFSVRGACGIGVCGACTVLLDGRVASSCILLTVAVAGRKVSTSEGLVDGGELSRVQQSFVDHQAFQCSYCIPGMVLAVHGCLDQNPDADEEEVREHLGGNLCRCGTYPQILEAV